MMVMISERSRRGTKIFSVVDALMMNNLSLEDRAAGCLPDPQPQGPLEAAGALGQPTKF